MALIRRVMMACAASFTAVARVLDRRRGAPEIHVLKDPNCGCCTAWIDILRENGFAFTAERGFGTLLIRHKFDNRIHQNLPPCRTGEGEGYITEGYVPPRNIRSLLTERPDCASLVLNRPSGVTGMSDLCA